MTITLEQIDLLRKRANVGYQEAKEALEKNNGDLVDSLAYLEKENKIKGKSCCSGEDTLWEKFKRFISKANKIKLIIYNKEETILKLPVTIAAILAVLITPVVIAAFILALVTGYKIKFQKENGEGYAVNDTLDKVSDAVNNAAIKVTDEIKNL